MRSEPDLHIDQGPQRLPDDVEGLALLRAVRGRGRDAAGLVELELDAVGDLVEVEVTELAASQPASAIAAAFAGAFAAARAATTVALEAHTEELTARVQRSTDDNVVRLEAIAAQAQTRMDEILATLEGIERGSDRG